jgi:hypothetical protein
MGGAESLSDDELKNLELSKSIAKLNSTIRQLEKMRLAWHDWPNNELHRLDVSEKQASVQQLDRHVAEARNFLQWMEDLRSGRMSKGTAATLRFHNPSEDK